MNYTEALTRYTANFIDELANQGLRDVIISPGSRSTPLAVLFAEHEKVNDWIVVDERSAAYFALGIAQAKKRPVALVCTSGTATANYLPAIVEAFYARVPLIVLTADRPHELRDIGASQTMNQIGMYHNFVKLFYEMALPEANEKTLAYARNRALRAMKTAKADNPGPVHVNFPFREPLMPDVTLHNLWGKTERTREPKVLMGQKNLSDNNLSSLMQFVQDNPRGVLVCGPQVDEQLGVQMMKLSKQLGVPVLADPLSQLRAGDFISDHIIATYDSLFRSEKVRTQLKPDYIIRFGAMPVSKHYSFYVTEHSDVTQFVVENNDAVREPTNHDSHYIIADGATLCENLIRLSEPNVNKGNEAWLAKWQRMDQIAQDILHHSTSSELTEGTAVRHVIEQLDDNSHLFIANSMPIRDVDTFFIPTEKSIRLYANRGVSGIDGTLSSALGVATTGEHVTLIIGDLSFYHDMNSLLIAKRYKLPITIILINNNGGGIFSFLPQAEDEKYFEHLFGTPLDIDFEHAVTMYGGKYDAVKNESELTEVLRENRETETFSVVEIKTDRTENVVWHRHLWEKITQKLEHHDEI